MNSKVLALMLLIVMFHTVGCYKRATTSITTQSISYEYEEPFDYCSTRKTEAGVDMECKEGSLTIRFITMDAPLTITDVRNDLFPAEDYILTDERDGYHSPVYLFAFIANNEELERQPKFAAISRIDDLHWIVAEGYPGADDDEFLKVFIDLLESFGPVRITK